MMQQHKISLDFYSLADLRKILEEEPTLGVTEEVEHAIRKGARFVQKKLREGDYIYGVNTGFGSLCETGIGEDEVEALQYKHVVSHACGVGALVSEEISRLVLLIKLLTFRSGHTGVSMQVVERLLDFWNHDMIPVIPGKGTVGASGDLAPLAHMSLPLLGMGQVHHDGKIKEAAEVLSEMGWKPLKLEAKEGLALTNGVQYINALAASCLMEIEELVKVADVLASVSIQAFSAAKTFYQAPYHETTYHEERRTVAANLRKLLLDSNHWQLPTCNRSKQDPYSFRCIPQVHGAIRQAVGYSIGVIERELNGVSDNPLFFPDSDEVLFGGNLHGESTAITLDLLAISVSELANISERRTYQLLSGQRGLPSFLVTNPGLNSGLMIIQYTSAALVNESKVLATPASVDTIPTCQLQEDHVSMGGTSAYKLRQIVENTEHIFAIELLTALQAVDLNDGLELSSTTREIHESFRQQVAFLAEDRVLAPDIERSRHFILEHLRPWSTSLELG